MHLVKQFLIIITISFLGEFLASFIPLPIPGSIYGLILMLLALIFKVFPVSSVKESSRFLINIMPIMFVPPAVAILGYLEFLKEHWWQISLAAFVSTFAVMIVSGLITQLIMNRKEKKNERIHQ